MKKVKKISVYVSLALVAVACNKHETVPSPTPDAGALNSFFNSNVAGNTQSFTINASSGGEIIGEQGSRIIIDPNSLYDQNNVLVSGNVTVELIEIFDRASMVLLNKPTMGRLPNGDKSTLLSGGEYFLKITQNGEELYAPNGIFVSLPTENTGGSNLDMALFNGEIIGNDLLWEEIDDTVQVIQDSVGGTWVPSYVILDNEWGWTNVDRFYSDPRPKTVLKAQLPDGFDNTNCEVYISYDGEPGALASLDTYTEEGYFSEHYGLIPIGLEVHFIAVTIIDGELNYVIKSATIADNHVEQLNSFQPISQAQLAVLINNLP